MGRDLFQIILEIEKKILKFLLNRLNSNAEQIYFSCRIL